MRNTMLACVASTLFVALGCGGGGGNPDLGDLGPIDPLEGLPALQTGDFVGGAPANLAPADLACFGSQTAPVGGSEVTFDLTVQEFFTMAVTQDLCVKIFPDNVPTNDACNPSSDYVTNALGQISLTGPEGSWYAYRVFPRVGTVPGDTYVGSLQVNFPVPPPATASPAASSIVQGTINGLSFLLGIDPVNNTAILAGTAFECAREPLYGAVARIFRADGTEIPGGRGSRDVAFRYFNGNELPSRTQPFTNVDGLYAIANVPVLSEGELIFVELWGRRNDMSAPEFLGCEAVPIHAGGISIVDLRGLRTDGPACPSAP